MISSPRRFLQTAGLAAAILFIPQGLLGQLTAAERVPWVGDTPTTTPPLANDLSPELTRKNVSHAMEKVADWELARAQPGLPYGPLSGHDILLTLPGYASVYCVYSAHQTRMLLNGLSACCCR